MTKLATLTGHTLRVLYLAVSPDGQTIVTGAGETFYIASAVFGTHLSHVSVDVRRDSCLQDANAKHCFSSARPLLRAHVRQLKLLVCLARGRCRCTSERNGPRLLEDTDAKCANLIKNQQQNVLLSGHESCHESTATQVRPPGLPGWPVAFFHVFRHPTRLTWD